VTCDCRNQQGERWWAHLETIRIETLSMIHCDEWVRDRTNGNSGNAHPFLHNLKPDNQLHTASCVQFSRPDSKKHMVVTVVFTGLLLQHNSAFDVLELCFSNPFILSGFAP
jgi:hypothetical protein